MAGSLALVAAAVVLLLIVFVPIVGIMILAIGWRDTAAIWGFSLAATAVIVVATYLLFFGMGWERS